jgi:hypothetical protein
MKCGRARSRLINERRPSCYRRCPNGKREGRMDPNLVWFALARIFSHLVIHAGYRYRLLRDSAFLRSPTLNTFLFLCCPLSEGRFRFHVILLFLRFNSSTAII